jgi:alpha-mannosidase
MRFKIRPSSSIQDAVNLGYELNFPLREVSGTAEVLPLVKCDSAQVIVESVKMAEDGSEDLIIRAYESTGGKANCRLEFPVAAKSISMVNFLEQPIDSSSITNVSGIDLELRAFQILTLRVQGLKF